MNRSTERALRVLILVLLMFSAGTPTLLAADNEAIREGIRKRIELMRSGASLDVGASHVASVEVLPNFYEARNFAPAWTDPGNRTQMLRAIDRAAEDGLNPGDYHRAALIALDGQLVSGGASAEIATGADLLFTDALVRLGYHIILGKVSPKDLEPTWNLEGSLGGIDPVKTMEDALASCRGRPCPG